MHRFFIKIFALLSVLFISITGFSQDAKVIELINDGEYQEAIQAIEHEGEVVNLDMQSLSSLGYCYIMIRDYHKAENIYREIVSRKKFDVSNHMYLGEVLLVNEKFEEAKLSFENFLKENPDSFAAQVKIASCDSLRVWSQFPSAFSVRNYNQVNTAFDEKSALMIDDNLLFVTSNLDEEFRSNQDPKLNVIKGYKVFNRNIENYFTDLLNEFSCDALDYCETRNLLAMTLRSRTEYLYETDFSNACIYFATPEDVNSLEKFEWEGMPENINLAHPAFAKKGYRLYFVSDMEGGIGANDIWYSDFENSKWQKPVNAGSNLNTKGNELFPVVYSDTLFFSTDGREGYGNLDVFMSIDGSNPVNMRSPVNSVGNDYSFHKNGTFSGYLSSNRSDACVGMNDIFIWNLPMPAAPVDVVEEEPEEEILVFNPAGFVLNPLYYASEDDKLESIQLDYLKQIADTMMVYPEIKLTITGHSDARGSRKYSEKLALSRAEFVADEMFKLGVEKERILVVSAGITKDRQAKGLTYHVQVGYSKSAKAESWFSKKLKMPVKSISDEDYYAYFVGSFDSKDDALKLKNDIKDIFEGIVIASFEGKRLPDLYYAPNRRVEFQLEKAE